MVMDPAKESMRKQSGELLVTITANFTAEPVADILRFWIEILGFGPARLKFSGYNQVFQGLIAPDSLLASAQPGVNFLLIRLEDWARDQKKSLQTEAIARAVQEFIETFKAFAERAQRPSILLLCPPSRNVATDLGLARPIRLLQEDVRREAAGLRGVTVIPADEVTALYPVEVIDDSESDREGHIPFSSAFWVAMGTMLVRGARTLLQAPRKVIAVDADNTLWGGIVAEAGAAHVQIGREYREMQELLRNRKEHGMLLVLVSKNKEEDVEQVFSRPDMILRREDFVAWKVNWKPKSENLRALSAELDLCLDSFIFLDDNPMECAEVAAHCPSVTVVPLPSQVEDVPSFLRHVWAFDLPPATSADKSRTAHYRQQADREEFRASALSFSEFMNKLELRVDLAAPELEQFERAAQLTQRTNQFNVTGVLRTASELGSLLASGERRALLVRVRDRFGDYGEVGLCVYSLGESELNVENFLLSCRVLGKGVEHRLLSELGRTADELRKGHVVIALRRTERNEPAAKFMEAVGGVRQGDLYRFSAAQARAVVFDPEDVKESLPADNERPTAKANGTINRCDFGEIAHRLAKVPEIQLAIRRMYSRSRPAQRIQFVAPRSPVEQSLAEICANVLGLDRVGIHDNFFDLGGDSIRSIQIISKASQSGFRFTLRQHFQYPTIAELASVIGTANPVAEESEPGRTNSSTPEFSLAKLGQKSLDQVLASLARAKE